MAGRDRPASARQKALARLIQAASSMTEDDVGLLAELAHALDNEPESVRLVIRQALEDSLERL